MSGISVIPMRSIANVDTLINATLYHDSSSTSTTSESWRYWVTPGNKPDSHSCKTCGMPAPLASGLCKACTNSDGEGRNQTVREGVKCGEIRGGFSKQPQQKSHVVKQSSRVQITGEGTLGVISAASDDCSKKSRLSRPAETCLGKRTADMLDGNTQAEDGTSTLGRTDAYELYQTHSDLYDALSSALKASYAACTSSNPHPQYVNFHGSYTIVADPKIPQWKRVEIVSTELRKVVKFPHSNKTYTRPMSAASWTETFQCDCSRGRVGSSIIPPGTSSPTPSTSSPPATQNPADIPASYKPVKRTQSSLSHWILNTSKRPKVDTPSSVAILTTGGTPTSEEEMVPGCGGKLHITAEEDNSHPLGAFIKGQKIIVVVEHATSP